MPGPGIPVLTSLAAASRSSCRVLPPSASSRLPILASRRVSQPAARITSPSSFRTGSVEAAPLTLASPPSRRRCTATVATTAPLRCLLPTFPLPADAPLALITPPATRRRCTPLFPCPFSPFHLPPSTHSVLPESSTDPLKPRLSASSTPSTFPRLILPIVLANTSPCTLVLPLHPKRSLPAALRHSFATTRSPRLPSRLPRPVPGVPLSPRTTPAPIPGRPSRIPRRVCSIHLPSTCRPAPAQESCDVRPSRPPWRVPAPRLPPRPLQRTWDPYLIPTRRSAPAQRSCFRRPGIAGKSVSFASVAVIQPFDGRLLTTTVTQRFAARAATTKWWGEERDGGEEEEEEVEVAKLTEELQRALSFGAG